MSEKQFFGETLEETIKQAEEMDEKNQERGGDGTVVLKNLADEKIRVNLSTEEVPEPKENN